MFENCKSLILQDKCNIEIFLSPVHYGTQFNDKLSFSKQIVTVNHLYIWWVFLFGCIGVTKILDREIQFRIHLHNKQ